MHAVAVIIGAVLLIFALIGFFQGLGLRRNDNQSHGAGDSWGGFSGGSGDHHGGDGGHGW